MKMNAGNKLAYCKRGHDTRSSDARDKRRACRKCKQLYKMQMPRNREYDILYEASYARQESRYSQYKKTLKERIRLKKERLSTYAEEILSRDGETEGSEDY